MWPFFDLYGLFTKFDDQPIEIIITYSEMVSYFLMFAKFQ